jgi:streptogramin lyase
MGLLSTFRFGGYHGPKAIHPRTQRPQPRTRLVLEGLEDRCLLAVSISEFTIPTTAPLAAAITAVPDGSLWFTEENGNKIGRVTSNGMVTEFPVPTPNSGPRGIASGPDGNLWFVEMFENKIGRVTPAGVITEFPIPTPNTTPEFITAGPDGNLWFTEGDGDQIGRITPAGVFTEFPLPTAASFPFGITAGPDGNLWFTENLGNRIGRITPAGVITEFPISTANSAPFDITTGPDGNLWFTEEFGNKIGRITPAGVITEFTIPTTNSAPRGITAGPDGNLWFTEFASNKIGQVTPAGFFVAEFTVPAGNNPRDITVGPHSTLAFTEFDRIGVVRGVLDANHSFIQSLYRNALGRAGSMAELDGWVSVLVRAGSGPVVNGIERSPEARTRLVKSWYVTFLGRAAQGGEEQVLSAILGSGEYFNRAPQVPGVGGGNPSNEKFIQALYSQLLNRSAGPGEISFWVGQLPSFGRGGVALRILQSAEYRGIVVRSYYRLLLHRPTAPTPAEVSSWVLSGLDFTRLRVALESSLEYYLNG